jgi:molybdopterin synthase catalytic subunit
MVSQNHSAFGGIRTNRAKLLFPLFSSVFIRVHQWFRPNCYVSFSTMRRELTISEQSIDEPAQLAKRTMSPQMGAAVYFLGVVRDLEAGSPISALEYESFQRMAEHQFHLLFDEIEKRWPVASIRLVHRIGAVKVNEPSLWVEVIAPHRGEAFAACQWLIDRMKELVPIWKKPRA